MKERGQIITIDFLMALVLVVFAFGLLIGFAELRSYEIKENISYKDLQEKTEAGLIVLSGGTISGCITDNGTILPASYDEVRKTNITKEALGLKDYNVSLEIDGEKILDDDLSFSKNSIFIDLEFEECSLEPKITSIGGNTVSGTMGVGK